MMTEVQQPPLPADLETAHKELRYWQRQVVAAREQLATNIQRREEEKRSSRGNIEALRTEASNLRLEIALLREALKSQPVPHSPASHPVTEEP